MPWHVDIQQCHIPSTLAHFFQGIEFTCRFASDYDIGRFAKNPFQPIIPLVAVFGN
uniref:hypothetical protein n=1 Tax=Nitrosospira sp. NpAV TaxID=58133 RepID=UPI000AB296AD|nr:hypothetical protein [Nitrosospira sp. NpAV]